MPVRAADDRTEVGSYFIANYPPFSVWTQEAVDRDVRPALAAPPTDVPLGLYLHIPFCRKRCHFCYFRVYTDKNAAEVQGYLDTLAREWELYSEQRAVAGRPLNFVYFGGGTPSFLSTAAAEPGRSPGRGEPVADAEEITFECEPGTLTEAKLAAIREIGVTRLSLGVEHFDDRHPRDQRPRAPLGRDRPRLRVCPVARLSADQHRPDRRHAGRDGRQLADVRREDDRRSSPTASPSTRWSCRSTRRSARRCARARRSSSGDGRQLVDQAALGGRSVRGVRARRLHRRLRLRRGQEPGDQVRLPRSALAGRRHGRPGRRVVRPHQRRAHAEPRSVRGLLREHRRAANCRWRAASGRRQKNV